MFRTVQNISRLSFVWKNQLSIQVPFSSLRKHPAQETGLAVHQHAEYERKSDGVAEGEAEQITFLTDHVGSRGSHTDGLGGDHLAGHTADGVGGDGQFRRNADGRSSGALHAGEEGVGGGVGTGEEHAQPADERSKEGEEAAGLGEGKAEGGAHAGVVHEERQTEHAADGDIMARISQTGTPWAGQCCSSRKNILCF